MRADPREAIETTRLTLEPIRPDHAEELFALLQDPTLYTYIPQEPPVSVAALRVRFERLAAGRSPDGTQIWLNWVARFTADSSVVGVYQATVYPDRTAAIAYLTFAGHQGRGVASEASAEVIRHLGARFGVRVVGADIDTRNRASIALIERLGFKRIRTTKDADVFKGATSDEFRYELRLPG